MADWVQLLIGEAERDEAPMLFIGKKVGKKESSSLSDFAIRRNLKDAGCLGQA